MLRLGVVGAIGPQKGSGLVYELVDLIKAKELPIQIVVIGTTNRHPKSFISADNRFIVTGAYDRKNVCQILSTQAIDIVLIPSIWPETFCFACVESLLCGYPVIVFDLGAQSEHVRSTGAGLVLTETSVGSVGAALANLLGNPASLDSLKTAARSLNASNTFLLDPTDFREKMIHILFE